MPDGSIFQTGHAANLGKTGDNFAIYFGRDNRDDPNFQPVDPYLQAKAGLDSAWPGLCHIVWQRKLLGGSPQWPLMKYEIETVP